ncbi:hypothetical protein CSB88_4963 [Pseudomonas aeruginosa]|nr:hypothetical protein CSB88_4963 [Pseudomonas aeruginosa]
MHHHVNRARCPRQSLGGPGAIQGGGEVGVGDVVLQGDPVGEADLRRRAAEPGSSCSARRRNDFESSLQPWTMTIERGMSGILWG